MSPYQQTLISNIEQLKVQLRTSKGESKIRITRQLKKLAHWLTEEDSREHELKFGHKNDPGGRSRSPSFGKWNSNNE
jgi:hypothetical protein